jgi:hypothetical protein
MAFHYEFFQRPTVHVNSLVLLFSTHLQVQRFQGFLYHCVDRGGVWKSNPGYGRSFAKHVLKKTEPVD